MDELRTEAEAYDAVCHHVASLEMLALRAALLNPAEPDPDPLPRCVGSRCQHWRWYDSSIEKGTIDHSLLTRRYSDEQKVEQLRDDGWERRDNYGKFGEQGVYERPRGERRRGYCGLSGRPHPGEPASVGSIDRDS